MGLRKSLKLLDKHDGLCDSLPDPGSYGPDYYNQRFEKVDQQRKPTKRYAKDTEEAIARMRSKWEEYGYSYDLLQLANLDAAQILQICGYRSRSNHPKSHIWAFHQLYALDVQQVYGKEGQQYGDILADTEPIIQ